MPPSRPISTTYFPRRPSRYYNPEQPSPGSLNPRPCCMPASGFSATYCLAPSPMWLASIRRTLKLFRADFLEQLVAQQSRRESLTARLIRLWLPIKRSVRNFRRASFPARLHKRILQPVFIRSQSQRCPTENFTRHTSWSGVRSEEHTSELQSLRHLVCRLLLEKK